MAKTKNLIKKGEVLPSLDEKEKQTSQEIGTNKEVALYRPSKYADTLTKYLQEISRYPLLSLEQEKALTEKLEKTGDIEIAKKLVLANLRLVAKIAMEYRNAYQNVMDLIQEGNIGLMKAVSKYDGTKGAKLSYYASWWIRSYILKFILDNFNMVKIGTTNEQKKIFYNLLKEKNKLISMGIEPETKLLAEGLGVKEKTLVMMEERLAPSGGERSLDADRFIGDPDSGPLSESLSDPNDIPIDDDLAHRESLHLLKTHLHDFLGKLNDRDKDIFQKRLLSEVPPSLQNIANEYGVSRERIRQIEERLINNLKVYMNDFIK